MSSNPISYTVDRRATHLRVAFRSLVFRTRCSVKWCFDESTPEDSLVNSRLRGELGVTLRVAQAYRLARGSDGLTTRK
jgi:hypothetical protein